MHDASLCCLFLPFPFFLDACPLLSPLRFQRQPENDETIAYDAAREFCIYFRALLQPAVRAVLHVGHRGAMDIWKGVWTCPEPKNNSNNNTAKTTITINAFVFSVSALIFIQWFPSTFPPTIITLFSYVTITTFMTTVINAFTTTTITTFTTKT